MNDLISTLQAALECGGDPEDIEEILNDVSALVKGPAEAWLLFYVGRGVHKKLHGVHATPESALIQAQTLVYRGGYGRYNKIAWLKVDHRTQEATWLRPEAHLTYKAPYIIERWPVEEIDA